MKSTRFIESITIGANLAVLAGLIFVGMEVRSSRAAVEAQIADSIAEGFMEVNALTIADPSVACIWAVGWQRPESLSDSQAAQFSMLARMVFNQYIRVHSLAETDFVAKEAWGTVASSANWLSSTAGGKAFLEANQAPPSFLKAISLHPPVPQDFLMGRRLPESCP